MPILKTMSSSMGRIIPYIMENEKMFETTHQQKNIRVTQGHQEFDTELSAESSCVQTLFTVMSKTQCHYQYPLVNEHNYAENHHVIAG